MWIAEAPMVVVACGWPRQAYPRMGGGGNSVDIDVAIALDHLTLAAVSHGLGTCWIGSFSEADVKRLIQLPPVGKVVAMTPLGYPAEQDLIHSLCSLRIAKLKRRSLVAMSMDGPAIHITSDLASTGGGGTDRTSCHVGYGASCRGLAVNTHGKRRWRMWCRSSLLGIVGAGRARRRPWLGRDRRTIRWVCALWGSAGADTSC